MRRTPLTLGLVLAVVAALLLGACTRPEPKESEGGRTLNIGATGAPAGLDPVTADGAGTPFVMLYNVFETLVKLDGEGNIKPLLATEWGVSDDNRVYTFTLDTGAKFSSGNDVTAEAVVANFERARGATATDTIRSHWAPVDTIEATNPDTVVVTLKQPSNMWLFRMTGSAGIIVDPASLDKANTAPVGSGPYTFSQWEEGSYVKLVGNPNYWGTPPRFGDVYFRYFADANAMVTQMLSGQLDIISNLTVPEALDQFKDESRFTIHEGTTDGEVVLGFNHRNPALQDVKVRQAINYAIDRKALVEAAWGGKGELIGSMVAPTDPWYEDLSNTYPYDPDKARQLLKEAGHGKGLKLTLRVPTLPYGPAAGRHIVAQLREVGIDVKFEEVEFGVWLDQVFAKHDFDMTIVAHVEQRDIGNFARPDYYWGYDNKEFQKLVAEADAGSQAEQTAKLKEAAKLLTDDAAADWLFLLPNLIITKPEISGVQANQVSLSFDLTTLASRG